MEEWLKNKFPEEKGRWWLVKQPVENDNGSVYAPLVWLLSNRNYSSVLSKVYNLRVKKHLKDEEKDDKDS